MGRVGGAVVGTFQKRSFRWSSTTGQPIRRPVFFMERAPPNDTINGVAERVEFIMRKCMPCMVEQWRTTAHRTTFTSPAREDERQTNL